MLTINNVTTMDPETLAAELRQGFTPVLLDSVQTTEDLWQAQKLLGIFSSRYAFLMSAAVEVKETKRRMKRERAPKEEIDIMMEREDYLNAFCEITKLAYASVSRMLAVRQQVYEELKLLKS